MAWEGTPVPGGRTQALLAVLVAAGGRTVGEERLAAEIWGPDDQPANPVKALQVVVSRCRAQTRADVVQHTDRGYRLAMAPRDVDALLLTSEHDAARTAEARGDLVAARDRARAALAPTVAAPVGSTALAGLRASARTQQATARAVLGRTASALGDHQEALAALTGVEGADLDEATLAALLRSEAAVHGAPQALARYEQHREHVRDSLGVDPGPVLQAVHAELLAADNPVRSGLRFETSSLVGRDDDLRALRALVGESRVTSILGPGGLGKTTLAHLLGRSAEQPVVHFVELVGIASPDDVVGEVGSVLGVRDSVSGRRVLTAEQRGDVRARISQQLDQAPTLLILDNCEHVIEAVADLVAFLVATAPRLRVVTTTRAPLSIAAERVFALDQLSEDAAVDLFGQRARAARPGVLLQDAGVRRVVARLDGLPLAIELAAARARVMSVDEIARRLDDRFALLRGNDRSAPHRHQTLDAVIDWSWNLLGPDQQHALRWLSVFHDGFTLDGADALLPGGSAVDLVSSLVDQSLLTVLERTGSLRYRMLETVREFGRLRLVEAGEQAAARAAQVQWARAVAAEAEAWIYTPRQFEVVDELLLEENNLADVMREALAARDQETTVRLLAALGTFWTIKGEHQRVIAMVAAIEDVLEGWEPPDHLVDSVVVATSVLVMNTAIAQAVQPVVGRRLLEAYADRATQPFTRAMATVLTSFDPTDLEGSTARMEALLDDPDRLVVALVLQFTSHSLENSGDSDAAVAAAERSLALWREEDGPWSRSMLHNQLAGLHAQLGRSERAAHHALEGLPVLDRLESNDDAIQLRCILAYAAMEDGRLLEARALVDQIVDIDRRRPGFAAGVVTASARAELALAAGEIAEGLRLYRVAVLKMHEMRFPGLSAETGLEPWIVMGEGAAVTAYAFHGRGTEGADLLATLRTRVTALLQRDASVIDFPVTGVALYALGAWGLVRESLPVADALRLVALADRFSYHRYAPTMTWNRVAEVAGRLAPGMLAEIEAEHGVRRGPELLAEARALVERISHLA